MDIDAATTELELPNRRFCFSGDVASLMWEHVQSHGPQPCKVKAAFVAAEAAQTAALSNFQSLTASESFFSGKVGQLTRSVKDLGEKAAGMRQKRDLKMEDVLFKCDGLQGHLDSTTSQLLGFTTH